MEKAINRSRNKIINIKYDSMAPKTLEESEIKPYKKAFQNCLDDESVKNIAFTGKYGAGKTSVIKTIIKNLKGNNKKDLKKRTLWLSLACFSNEIKKKQNNKGEPLWKSIEKSLVQQMLYMPANSDLPLSRYRKIEPMNWLKKLSYFILIVTFVISLILLLNFGNTFTQIVNTFEIDKKLSKKILLFSFFSILIFLLWIIFEYSGYNLKISKFNIGKSEFKINESRSEFNFYFDEILYFFLQEQYSIVIFEDIDRFDDINVFEHLRELNNLLNNNEKLKNLYKKKKRLYPIKFVYAIRDDIFSSAINNVDSSRLKDDAGIADLNTKFFEWIIPIVPFMSHSNTASYLLNRFSESNQQFQNFLRNISLYCVNIRIWESVINDFILYQDLLSNMSDYSPEKLFSILFFKNMYPLEYNDFVNARGSLYKILYTDLYYNDILKDDEEKIEEKKHDYEQIKNLDEYWIVSYFKGKLLDKGYQRNLYINSNDSKLSFNMINYKNLQNLYKSSYKNKEDIEVSDLANSIRLRIPFNDLFEKTKQLDPSKIFLNNNVSANYGFFEKLEVDKHEIEKMENSIDEIKEKNIASLIKTDSKDIIGELLTDDYNDECVNYLRFSLSEGYIDETSIFYLSTIDEKQISEKDLSVIRKLRSGSPIHFSQKIENVKNFILGLNDNDFNKPGMKLEAIIEFGMYHKFSKNKKDENRDDNDQKIKKAYIKAIDLVCDQDNFSFDDDIRYLLDNLIKSNKSENSFEKTELLKILSEKLQFKWHIIDKKIKIELYNSLLWFLDINDLEKTLNNNEDFVNYINDETLYIGILFMEKREKAIELVRKNPIKINDIKLYYDENHSDFIGFLIKENKIEINIYTIPEIIMYYINEPYEGISYDLIGRISNKSLINFVNININDFITTKFNSKNSEQLPESKKSLISLLKNKTLKNELKERLIKTYDKSDLELQEIPDKFVRLAFDEKKYKLSWNNLEFIENNSNFDSNMLCEFVKHSKNFENIEAQEGEINTNLIRKAVNSCAIKITSKNKNVICLVNDYDGYNQDIETVSKMINLNVVKLSDEIINYSNLGKNNLIKLSENKIIGNGKEISDKEKELVDKLELSDLIEILQQNSSGKLTNIVLEKLVNEYLNEFDTEIKGSKENDPRLLVAQKCLEQYEFNEKNYFKILDSIKNDYELMIDLMNLTRYSDKLELDKIIPFVQDSESRRRQISEFETDKALLDKLHTMKIIGVYKLNNGKWTVNRLKLKTGKLKSKTEFLKYNDL